MMMMLEPELSVIAMTHVCMRHTYVRSSPRLNRTTPQVTHQPPERMRGGGGGGGEQELTERVGGVERAGAAELDALRSGLEVAGSGRGALGRRRRWRWW